MNSNKFFLMMNRFQFKKKIKDKLKNFILFIKDAGAYSLMKIFCNKENKNNILSVTDNNAN